MSSFLPPVTCVTPLACRKPSTAIDYTDRLLQAVANQQKQMKSKRFKSNDSSKKDEEPTSEYHKLKTVHQSREGDKGEEGSKWLVR